MNSPNVYIEAGTPIWSWESDEENDAQAKVSTKVKLLWSTHTVLMYTKDARPQRNCWEVKGYAAGVGEYQGTANYFLKAHLTTFELVRWACEIENDMARYNTEWLGT